MREGRPCVATCEPRRVGVLGGAFIVAMYKQWKGSQELQGTNASFCSKQDHRSVCNNHCQKSNKWVRQAKEKKLVELIFKKVEDGLDEGEERLLGSSVVAIEGRQLVTNVEVAVKDYRELPDFQVFVEYDSRVFEILI